MAHDTHGAAVDHAHHAGGEHPELPPVQDEAADTPMWLPVTGLVLLALLTLFVLWRAAQPAPEAPVEAAVADAPAEVEAAPAE
ncbi:hypothetical protein [Sandaracinus amylolyticus]|uniref:Uncharacterized protein n=1 Tax=Sandaracinus amylolyticus TaxID=927083 RepID=A0A0F6SGF0_9BACT|nr:hypothetical protein [Sandaracinus amylolyticus]AKF08579.1 hypothetical protein DB32_005728 [Sandaracinus amylolyticus]